MNLSFFKSLTEGHLAPTLSYMTNTRMTFSQDELQTILEALATERSNVQGSVESLDSAEARGARIIQERALKVQDKINRKLQNH